MLKAFALLSVMTCGILVVPGASYAQDEEDNRGFVRKVPHSITGEESVNQPNIWGFDIEFKQMRMIRVPVTDPATGKTEKKLVWYLVYRTVRRPVARPVELGENDPVNVEDPEPETIFLPEFLLMSTDNDVRRTYPDQVIPEAIAVIAKRERQKLLSTVEMMRTLPDPVPADAGDQFLYGVATWTGVDPDTDNYTVYMNGLSNGYRVVDGPDGNPMMLRRVLTQNFFRPGDALEETEREIRFDGKSAWTYLPEQARPKSIPDLPLDPNLP